ncbi:MAG: biotin transporter BioY [Planctomycetota bacterium]|jgi:biotin transport system substrate-specific component|nr:biotin transporter BioY [Planctomycetota bacterium]
MDMTRALVVGAAGRRASFYAWRDRLGVMEKGLLALSAAAFIGLCAQLSIPLPFTPIPLSLQTFAIASSAVALGWGWGILASGLYVGLAAAGMPWLVGLRGGWAAVAGPTGGYLLGFVLMAVAMSRFGRDPSRCRWLPTWLAWFLSDVFLILLPGSIWLYFWLNAAGSPTDWAGAFAKGFLPFVVADFFKSGAASLAVAWLGRR